MTSDVFHWYGVTKEDENVIFAGTEAEITDFRNACHAEFARQNSNGQKKFFPYATKPRQYGRCADLSGFRKWTAENYHFETKVGVVNLVNKDGQRHRVHPTK